MTVKTWGEFIGALLGVFINTALRAVLVYLLWLFMAWIFDLWYVENLILPLTTWQVAGIIALIVTIFKR